MKSGTGNRENIFVRKAFYRFFLPSLVSTLGLGLGGLADCVFVGSAIGATGLSVISLVQPVYMLFNTISFSLSIGGGIRYAAALSEGKKEEGNRIFANILCADLLINIVLCILGLLFLPQILAFLGAGTPGSELWANCEAMVRAQLLLVPIMFCQGPFYYFINADNNPKLSAAALVASNSIDIAFNYIFVILMDMGVVGSVYSTGLGAAVMILISLTHFIRKKGCLRFTRPRFQGGIVAPAFRTGFDTVVQYIYQFVTILVCNHLLMSMGGELGVAVFGIVFNVSLMAASMYDAISMAIQPMVSTFLGERNRRNILCTLRQAFKASVVMSALLVLLIVLFPQGVCFAFGLRTAEEFAVGVWAIRIYALCVLPAGINMVMIYYYQTLGKEFISYVLITLRSLVLFLLFSLIFSRSGMELFWLTYPCMEMATLAVLAVYNRIKGSWTYLEEEDGSVYTAFLDSRTANLGEVEQEVSRYLEGLYASPTQSYFAAVTVEEVCGVILERGFGAQAGYIQLTLVPHEDGTVTIDIRDNAGAFNPFAVNTDEISLEEGTGLDAIGMKMIKSKAKEFFYRRYAGFNTLMIRV